MKSIKEKAKAYDEAIKRAQAKMEEAKVFDYDDEQTAHTIRLTTTDIFPELKESEDEKIRKALKEYFINSFQNNGVAAICGVHIKDILAWLEKQKGTEREIYGNSLYNGEQKPVVPRFRVGDTIRNKKTNRLFYVHHLSEAGFLSLSDTNKTVYQGYLGENDFENYELVEQKPAWSEEDEEKMVSIFLGIETFCPSIIYGNGKEEVLNWFKSLKDRVQSKQEWSEEDDALLYGVIETEQYMLDVVTGEKTFDVGNEQIESQCTKELAWLKILKDRYTWKPSDEQMNALNYVVNLMASSERPTENDLYYNILKSLRQQLKKHYL